MKTHSMGAHRGSTLIEMLIAVAVLAIAMVAASSLVVATGRMVRNNQEISDSNDGSRIGGEAVAKSIENAGLGAPQGIWISWSGLPTRTNPIFGIDGVNAPDDLWVVVPFSDGLQPTYAPNNSIGEPVRYGAIVSGLWSAGNPLTVSNTTNFILGVLSRQYLITNLTSGALITPTAIGPSGPGSPGTITFSESGSGLSPSPQAGYVNGDFVMEAQILRFYVGPTLSGSTGLYRSVGKVFYDASRNIPFTEQITPGQLLQDQVEDFQVAYGFEDPTNPGDPTRYIFQNGLPAIFKPNLRAVRITVVAMGKQAIRDANDKAVVNPTPGPDQVGVPLVIENHTPPLIGFPNAGYRRSVYRRRVETLNLAMGLL